MSLRRAGRSDAPAMARIAQESFSPYLDRMDGRRPAPMDADHQTVVTEHEAWVVEVEGQVIGFVVLQARHDHLLLDTVAVAPAHQGRGVGGVLLGHAEQRAQDLGLPRLELYTHETMTENQDRYVRAGYRETHRATHDGFARVHYSKTIAT